MPNDPTTPSEALVEVTQADRDAAAAIIHGWWRNLIPEKCRDIVVEGLVDGSEIVQAFARHRLATLRPPVQPGELAATAETMADLIAAVMERHQHNDVFTVGRKDLEAIWNILATLQAPAPVQAGELIERCAKIADNFNAGVIAYHIRALAALSTEATALPQPDRAWLISRLLGRADTLEQLGRENRPLTSEHDVAHLVLTRDLLREAAAALSPPITEQPQGIGFCNKCGYCGPVGPHGTHNRPKTGEPCNYMAPAVAGPAEQPQAGDA